jgi:hypothetical protein
MKIHHPIAATIIADAGCGREVVYFCVFTSGDGGNRFNSVLGGIVAYQPKTIGLDGLLLIRNRARRRGGLRMIKGQENGREHESVEDARHGQ